MDRHVLAKYTHYLDSTIAPTKKEFYPIDLPAWEIIKTLCNDFRKRQVQGESLTFKPTMVLEKGVYYHSVKVKLKNNITEYYYIIPFTTVSMREYI